MMDKEIRTTDFERFKALFDSMERKYEIGELPDYNLIHLMPEGTNTVLEFRLSDGEYLK